MAKWIWLRLALLSPCRLSRPLARALATHFPCLASSPHESTGFAVCWPNSLSMPQLPIVPVSAAAIAAMSHPGSREIGFVSHK